MNASPVLLNQITASVLFSFQTKSLKIMPKAISKRSKSKRENEDLLSSPELSDDEVLTKNENKPYSSLKLGNKRSFHEIANKSGGGDCAIAPSQNPDYGNDIKNMLDTFGSDVNKALHTKKLRLEEYTEGTMKANQSKVQEMLQYQSEGRRHHHEELRRNINSVMEQWETDLSRGKEQEEKLQKIFQQQMKTIQQNRAVQLQRLTSIRQIYESYYKGFMEQESKQNDQCKSMLVDLRKELNEMQKKMMAETQKEEMAHMQKSLKSMLFM